MTRFKSDRETQPVIQESLPEIFTRHKATELIPCLLFGLFSSFERYRNGHRVLTRVKNALRRSFRPVKNYRARFTRDFRSTNVSAGSRKVPICIKVNSRSGTNRSRDTLPQSPGRFPSMVISLFFFFSFFFPNPLKASLNFVATIVKKNVTSFQIEVFFA